MVGRTPSEVLLKSDVAELAYRAGLAEHASMMGVIEERH
jgi:hypothetical protein